MEGTPAWMKFKNVPRIELVPFADQLLCFYLNTSVSGNGTKYDAPCC